MSGILVFDREAVAALVAEVEAAEHYRGLYGVKTGPGLWLVGDHGVYLMGNQELNPTKPPNVVYAEGINPLEDENFYASKRMIFGGDDGAEFLKLQDVKEWLDRYSSKPHVSLLIDEALIDLH